MKERVIIAGTRDFNNYGAFANNVSDFLTGLCNSRNVTLDEIEIVSGGCRGTDMMAERYAREHEIEFREFPAHWDAWGNKAGYIRNCKMAQYASEPNVHGTLIAFWDGMSRGTRMMIGIAEARGIDVHVVRIDNFEIVEGQRE